MDLHQSSIHSIEDDTISHPDWESLDHAKKKQNKINKCAQPSTALAVSSSSPLSPLQIIFIIFIIIITMIIIILSAWATWYKFLYHQYNVNTAFIAIYIYLCFIIYAPRKMTTHAKTTTSDETSGIPASSSAALLCQAFVLFSLFRWRRWLTGCSWVSYLRWLDGLLIGH